MASSVTLSTSEAGLDHPPAQKPQAQGFPGWLCPGSCPVAPGIQHPVGFRTLVVSHFQSADKGDLQGFPWPHLTVGYWKSSPCSGAQPSRKQGTPDLVSSQW